MEEDRKAYIDPEKSAVAREEGNAKFKAGDFATAVKDYTESIKRDPSDARGYNNRAAVYMKLVAFPEALKDVNEAIKVDSKFGKCFFPVVVWTTSELRANGHYLQFSKSLYP